MDDYHSSFSIPSNSGIILKWPQYALGAKSIHALGNVYNKLPKGGDRGSFTPILNQQKEVPPTFDCHRLGKTLSNLIELDLL